MTGGENTEIIEEKKVITTEVFKEASFTIHKWHSNLPDLEAISSSPCEKELAYAKQQLGGAKPSERKISGVAWDKEQDVISVILQITQTETTKRGVLSHLAKIYDPLGLVSPVTLIGKQLALSLHVWRQDSVGHSTLRDATGTMEWLEQRTDWEPNSTTNTRSLLSTDFEPFIACIWRRQCKGSPCCSLRHCPSRSRSHSATRLRKVKTYNTKTWAGRWSHDREPRNKRTSSLKLPTTRNSLLAGLNRSALLDQGSIDNSLQTECTRSMNTTKSSGIMSQLKIIPPTGGVEEEIQWIATFGNKGQLGLVILQIGHHTLY